MNQRGILPNPVSDGVNRVNHPAPRASFGIGSVILSRETSEKEYIEKCYRNKLLTIITDRNEIIKDCYVERNVWQYIKFPKDIKEKGSLVIWINPPLQNRPIVIGVLSSRFEVLDTEQVESFNLTRQTQYSSVSIEGLGENGILNISLDGETDEDTKLHIRLLNTMSEALYDMYVQGDINIEGDNDFNIKLKRSFNITLIDENKPDKSVSLKYLLGTGLSLTDEFNNSVLFNNDGLHITVEKSDKITFEGNGNPVEPGLLGTTTKNLLNDLNNNLINLTNAIQTAVATGSFAAFAASLTPQLVAVLVEMNKVTSGLVNITAKNVEVS